MGSESKHFQSRHRERAVAADQAESEAPSSWTRSGGGALVAERTGARAFESGGRPSSFRDGGQGAGSWGRGGSRGACW